MSNTKKYNTHLASEFHVLSVLFRLGADAALTLGNKKAVDISVIKSEGEALTIDVKGVAGKDDWPADNLTIPEHDRQFIGVGSLEKRIDKPDEVPSVWIVPARRITEFVRSYKSRKVVSRSDIVAKGGSYRDRWNLILDNT